MKQFQKYGVAAAVATVAAGAVAQPTVSSNNAGDLAIVPYYTVEDGKNTGIHIINTTDSTQVVKVRLRRGADSKDALDFNLVMSPYDEWTANIGAGGDTGVRVTTGDNTCTVPAFDNGVAQMPDTYAEGATEGYVEIIGMAEAASEDQLLAITAEHTDAGVPLACSLVRENFFRVAADDVYAAAGDSVVKGVHTNAIVSHGVCDTAAVAAATGGALCDGDITGLAGASTEAVIDAYNVSNLVPTSDTALKVSYFITDSDGGLEAGGNAVHIEGFSQNPMMTNQQPLSFGTAGKLEYDPLNFELPNLAYGAYPSNSVGRVGAASNTDGSMFVALHEALSADSLINDWAAFSTDTGTVATDWVVTLPGQYVMNNPICDLYGSYTSASTACKFRATATDTGVIDSAGVLSDDELPLILAANVANSNTGESSRLLLWDREEKELNGEDAPDDSELGFSPGGSAGDPTNLITLNREVNVLVFGEEGSDGVLDSAELQSEDLGLKVIITPEGGDRGWGQLQIESTNGTPSYWGPGADTPDDDDVVDPNADGNGFGEFVALNVNTVGNPMAVGFAIWERSFAEQAGNYGRMVEHTTTSSTR